MYRLFEIILASALALPVAAAAQPSLPIEPQQQPAPAPAPAARALPSQQRAESQAERAYQRGTAALDERQWERAIQAFSEVPKDAPRADGALYWTAYAKHKLGRRTEALADLAGFQKSFPNSRWLNEARALEAEVKQAAGQPVSPETEADDDLKLMAINAMLNTDPERAAPLLEKVLQGNHPPKLKERALFVLSQSRAPRAQEIIAAIARGKSNPDLQMKALQYLGLFGGQGNRQMLAEIYASSPDLAIKRAILRSFMVAGERERLMAAAKEEKSAELRSEAIRQLGIMGAQTELWELYQAESSTDLKKEILRSFFVGGNGEKLAELARTEKDADLRLAAVRNLGLMGKRWGEPLTAIYAANTDKQVRMAVLHALFLQQNAQALIDIARKETDPELKKEAVHRLSLTGSKEATDFMMEILNK
jgi:hypothetical protein